MFSMNSRGLLTTLRYAGADNMNYKELLKVIAPADNKINERQKAITIKEKRKKAVQKEQKQDH